MRFLSIFIHFRGVGLHITTHFEKVGLYITIHFGGMGTLQNPTFCGVHVRWSSYAGQNKVLSFESHERQFPTCHPAPV